MLFENVPVGSTRQYFIQRRKMIGFTQESLAAVLNVDPRTVGRWESGQSQPQPHLRPRLAAALKSSLAELHDFLALPVDVKKDNSADSGMQLDVEKPRTGCNSSDLVSQLTILGVKAETAREFFHIDPKWHIGDEHIRLLRIVNTRLEHGDAATGVANLFPAALTLHTKVNRWIRDGVYSSRMESHLQHEFGDLATWCAWLAIDARSRSKAYQILHETIVRARITDDTALEVRCMVYLSLLLADDSPYESLQLTAAVRRMTRRWKASRLYTILHLRDALAYTTIADRHRTRDAISRARIALEGDSMDEPAYLDVVDVNEVDGIEGDSYRRLGDFPLATSAYRRMIENANPTYHRNIAYYTTRLADSLTDQGDYVESGKVALNAVLLARHLNSRRISDTLLGVHKKLAPHRRKSGDIAAFIDAHEGELAA